ncbi:MAG: hypothetical protein IPK12_02000 [Gemmatimonadetes bacterium]|nr:hypothetical protein [Gemmatimonadota bacterium]
MPRICMKAPGSGLPVSELRTIPSTKPLERAAAVATVRPSTTQVPTPGCTQAGSPGRLRGPAVPSPS